MGWLSIAATLLSGLVKIWEQFGSDTAILNRLKTKQAEIKGRQEAEADRLKADYERIWGEPDLTGQALVDKLNQTARKLRHKP